MSQVANIGSAARSMVYRLRRRISFGRGMSSPSVPPPSISALTSPPQVIGIDIAPTQPEWSPPNCRFEIANAEDPWLWQRESIDFIFARDLITAIRDWPKLIDSVYTYVAPARLSVRAADTLPPRCVPFAPPRLTRARRGRIERSNPAAGSNSSP